MLVLGERRHSAKGVPQRHWKPKQQVILRTCNELLRRLSRAEDTVFCGRVFIFLFQSFPLGDKSSVNLRGEFHTDNVTTYDQVSSEIMDGMEVDGVERQVDGAQQNTSEAPSAVATVSTPISVATSKAPVEVPKVIIGSNSEVSKVALDTDTLYPMFWSLQEYFAQPTKLFDVQTLQKFKVNMEATLVKFKAVHKDLEPRSNARSSDDVKQGQKRKFRDMNDNTITAFNPKYLTSRDLFELEISDLAFRRHVLVQAWIVTDFLLGQTPKAKLKLENLKNKSVIYSYAISDEDVSWFHQQTRNFHTDYM